MKISMSKFDILFIFVAIFLIEFVAFTTCKTAVLGAVDSQSEIQNEIILEQEDVYLCYEEQETLDLINRYRTANGLGELKAISSLQEVAKLKAEDLVNNNYFSHTSENLGTPFEMLKDNGISYKIAGENLAGNTTPKRAVEAWINSETHRNNILEEKFDYTGICVIESPVYGKVYVQLFMGI